MFRAAEKEKSRDVVCASSVIPASSLSVYARVHGSTYAHYDYYEPQ